MHALVLTKQGKPVAGNVQFINDWPDPGEPGAGEVRIRTLASAFNHMDLWVGGGLPGATLEFPRISGADGCGVVEAVGAGVDGAWVGRRVAVNAAIPQAPSSRPDDPPGSTLAPSYHLMGETLTGMHREAFCCPVANIADIGDADAGEAAAFALTFLTAWSMMVTKGQLRAGQSVLITGIGGGVATAALAIARHFGCRTIVTSRHQRKLDAAKDLGADDGVLDEGSDWSRSVRTLTGKRGVDMAVDSVGKAAHLWCLKSLARGGAYVTCGCTSGPDATTDLARIFWNQLRVLGSTMGTPEEFGEVMSLFRRGILRPTVDREFAPEQGVDAYARLESGEQMGKIVIRWSDG
ncbi:MAG: alcohol dehydrogenase [Phycisphaeraceae bacterium]|nr:MAG: alcohol dehydrogenase [Phycisphaeraceae bacterium]